MVDVLVLTFGMLKCCDWDVLIFPFNIIRLLIFKCAKVIFNLIRENLFVSVIVTQNLKIWNDMKLVMKLGLPCCSG